ncbi:MAG: PadR family transcriptional regulator [Firmicutes bacterium]|nr:PadR family transcriptional regulator [Bacillota bacterium]
MRHDALSRFSDVSFLVLSSLAEGPKHGYAMIQDIEQFSGTRLEPGTLYGAISRLERQGWIEALPAEDRRRPYCVTPDGLAALQAYVRTLEQVVSVGRRRLVDAGNP